MGRDRDSEEKKAGKRDLRTPIVDPHNKPCSPNRPLPPPHPPPPKYINRSIVFAFLWTTVIPRMPQLEILCCSTTMHP